MRTTPHASQQNLALEHPTMLLSHNDAIPLPAVLVKLPRPCCDIQ